MKLIEPVYREKYNNKKKTVVIGRQLDYITLIYTYYLLLLLIHERACIGSDQYNQIQIHPPPPR